MITEELLAVIVFLSMLYLFVTTMYIWGVADSNFYNGIYRFCMKTLNIVPITRLIGIILYGLVWVISAVFGGLIMSVYGTYLLIDIFRICINKGICWILLGRTRWKSEKKSELEKALDNSNKLATKVLQENSLDGFEAAQGEPIRRQYGNPDGTYKYFPNGTQYKPAEPVEGIKSDKSIRWGRWQERYNKDNSGTEWYFVPNIPDEEWKHLTHTERKKLSDEGKKHEKGRFDK